MDTTDMFKVLANDARLQILQWLKEPEHYFPSQAVDVHQVGICVGDIQQKAGLAQSTVSHYLSMLEETGFVIATRQGHHTYYRRNEAALLELIDRVTRL
ncbi:MAG: helix-turn-helix transcriptional regulator [Leptolyngbyaceae cyanobacterium SL_7_1]|nr:helix-turn-helix transcriptional regulator [Leptolyngbyaceae cyanobacterium SL_7_1]